MKYILIHQDKTGPTPFNTVTVDDVLSCTVICEDDPLCVIFAFHDDRQQCNIYHQLITDSELQHDAGMRMFKIGNIGENIALQKPTYKSSRKRRHNSDLAVDGDTISTCFETKEGDFSPYFIVDLSDIYHISYVMIHNTLDLDHYPERLHDLNIELYHSNPVDTNSTNPACCGFRPGLLPTGPTTIKCQDGVLGRFVKIFIEKSEFMTLCEVEITGHKVDDISSQRNTRNVNGCKRLPSGPNIALGKPTVQSSTYVYENLPLSSALAVDGNRNSDAFQLSCSHTAGGDNPWLQVDLERIYNITSVTIVNRGDHREITYGRMVDISILVYESDPTNTPATPGPVICKFIPGIFGMTSRTFECDDVTEGRYVRINKNSEILDVCELEVTGNLNVMTSLLDVTSE
ncbi:hypothetical protein SNE40_005473 [Patella caerulea]